jgi:hypothetical protein
MMKSVRNNLTDTIELGNGLTLEILDRSKQIAGDRWLVSIAARVETEVRPELFEGEEISERKIKGIQALAGETACYQYEDQRNFVDEAEKDIVIKMLKKRFLDTNLKYLSSPGFPKKLMLHKLRK